MNIALFTQNFLEPTHHAIAQVLSKLSNYNFHVYAKRFTDQEFFEIKNVESRLNYLEVNASKLADKEIKFIHSIYDGTTAFKACDLAEEIAKPYLLSFHGGYDMNAKIFNEKYKQSTIDIINRANEVTVITSLDVARLKRIGITRHINIIPVPIDLKLLPDIVGRDKFGLIAIGRMIEKKGIETAIRVLSILPWKYHLTIIGNGELLTELKSIAKELGVWDRISWLGLLPLNETLFELNKNGILLHPAKTGGDGNAEGTPQIILWAQAMKIPVVTTNNGSIPDIVENFRTGLIVDENGTIDEYADAIKSLASVDMQMQIVGNAFANVSQKHSIEKIATKWNVLYSSLTSRNVISTRTMQNNEFNDPLVVRSLERALEYFNLDKKSAIPFCTGGIGVIFLLEKNDKKILLKVPYYSKRNHIDHQVLRNDLLKEAMALAEINCSIVPKLIYVDPNGEFLARDYIEGETLSSISPSTDVSRREKLLLWLINSSRILFKCIHQHPKGNYVIRDLKPANLIIPNSNSDLLFLVDLGSIRPESDMVGKNSHSKRLGAMKWLFWSPEQLMEDKLLLDRRTDYFSFGVTAYAVLTGKLPYTNSENNKTKVLANYLAEYSQAVDYILDYSKKRSISEEYVDLIIQCIHPIPENRKFIV